jgi:sugar O-acyltransferase (sialic acid O-acetyltransferase NeuD family)
MLLQSNRLMATKIIIFGASGHGKVIADLLQSAQQEVVAFLDDNPKQETILGISVFHTTQLKEIDNFQLLIGVGNNSIRKKLSQQFTLKFATGIHPTAILSPYYKVGEGTVIMAGVIINPNVDVGKHCILNTGCIIEHDCTIEDYVHISPGVSLAGDVSVGEGTHIGIGSSVIQGIKIGKWATIGAGTVIIRDVPDYAVIVGNPGKIIKYHSSDE